MSDDNFIIHELARIRKEKGVSTCEVANAIGVTRDRIRKYETLFSEPPFHRVVKWAEFLGYELDLMKR